MTVNLALLRDLLQRYFSREELKDICLDHEQEFKEAERHVDFDASKKTVVDGLIEYAWHRGYELTLLAWFKEKRPVRYNLHKTELKSAPHLSAAEGVLFPQVGGTEGSDTGGATPVIPAGEPQLRAAVNLRVLQELLESSFSVTELKELSMDYPDEFGEAESLVDFDASKKTVVDGLIEYAWHRGYELTLLAWFKEKRPIKYRQHEADLWR